MCIECVWGNVLSRSIFLVVKLSSKARVRQRRGRGDSKVLKGSKGDDGVMLCEGGL